MEPGGSLLCSQDVTVMGFYDLSNKNKFYSYLHPADQDPSLYNNSNHMKTCVIMWEKNPYFDAPGKKPIHFRGNMRSVE
jgi:hypothetical protein